MSLIKELHRFLVFIVIVCLVPLMFFQDLVHVPRQLRPQLVTGVHPQRHTSRTVGYDQPLQSSLFFYRPHCAQHATPALAKQVIVICNAEVFQQVLQFRHQKLRRPEIGIQSFLPVVGALTIPNLVVEDYWYSIFLREIR